MEMIRFYSFPLIDGSVGISQFPARFVIINKKLYNIYLKDKKWFYYSERTWKPLEGEKIDTIVFESLDTVLSKWDPKERAKVLEDQIREISSDQLPQDRTFRNAWTDEYNTKTIDVDMNKAFEIQKNRFREARDPLLKDLDIQFMKAVETLDIDKQGEIAEQKQALRDVTKIDMSHIKTPEELKEFWPDILKGE